MVIWRSLTGKNIVAALTAKKGGKRPPPQPKKPNA